MLGCGAINVDLLNPLLTSTVTASGLGGGRSSFDVSTPGVTAACADTLPVPIMVPVVVFPAVPGVPACPVLTLLAAAAAVDDPGTGSAPPDTPSYVACVVLSVFVGASMPVLAGPTLGGSALEGSVVALGVVIRPVAGLACNGGGLLGLFTESSLTVCPAEAGGAGCAVGTSACNVVASAGKPFIKLCKVATNAVLPAAAASCFANSRPRTASPILNALTRPRPSGLYTVNSYPLPGRYSTSILYPLRVVDAVFAID